MKDTDKLETTFVYLLIKYAYGVVAVRAALVRISAVHHMHSFNNK